MDKKLPQSQLEIPSTPIRFFLCVTKPYKWWAIAAILAVVSAASASVYLQLFIEQIVENIEQNKVEIVVYLSLFYPVLYFFSQMTWRLSGWCGSYWLIGSNTTATNILSRYLMNHSHRYFGDRFAGSLSNKLSNVARSMEEFVAMFLWNLLENTVPLVLTTVIFWQTDPLLGICFVGLILFSLILNIVLMPRKRKFSLALAETESKTTGFIVDVITNISAVRQFSRRGDEYFSVQEHTSDVYGKGRRSFMYSEYMMIVNSVVFAGFTLFMFMVLSNMWAAGEVSSGRFVSFILLTTYTSGTFVMLGRIVSQVAKMYGQAEDGLNELTVSHEVVDIGGAKELMVNSSTIDWKSVGFKYEGQKVFDDFNLSIAAGQRIGLVGHSGAGKTTFVSLLLRQHDIESGSIKIDEQNIAEVKQDSLRKAIAVVPQEPLLFHRTIRENIAYGKPGATDDEIIEVAKKAQAHNFITALPDSYDTMVGERGVKLSGGQKQRVAIARAMLKDAPILVLDEATSALDSESEVLIQQALENLMEGRTVIAVAHRLSTLRKMDRIIVMEEGSIIEDGNHEQLSKAGGVYEALWNHQAGGFLQD
tara:strand:- start:307 stop:2073 length:1767 start_codon:yes stop_codon:yes gene_type:complete